MEDHMSPGIGGAPFEVGDGYDVLGLLGEGSFGTVATATDHETGKKLAIKRIHPIAGSRSGARHILREVSIMRALRYHPNIINLEDVRIASDLSTLYIVMELMECDLQRILASGQVLTADHVKVLLKQLLLGVQAMHRQGFLHRDLKPANILLLSDCQLRITDFGHSRRINTPSSPPTGVKPAKNDAADDEFSLTGYVVTRWYRAPEVMLGPDGSYGEPADIWSVGCIFGEMLGSRGALFPGKHYIEQVSLTLGAVGNPGVETNDALGYELSEDALKFLRTVEHLNGRALESLVAPDVDKEAFHLLKSLLDMNTRHRLTVQQAVEHAFLSDCPRLPTAAANSSGDLFDDDAPDFSFEDDELTAEELGKLVAAQAASFEDTRREFRRGKRDVESDVSLNLRPTPSLKDVLGVVRSQVHRPDREGSEGARAVQREVAGDAATSGGLGSSPRATAPTLEKRFSSMANLAEAEHVGVDAMDGSCTASARDVSLLPLGAPAENRGCGVVVSPADVVSANGTASSDEVGGVPAEGEQPIKREDIEGVSTGCPISVEQDQPPHFPALRAIGTEEHKAQRARREQSATASGPPSSQPAPSEIECARDPSRKYSAGSSVNTEDVAATRTQATCRRRAALNVASSRRNKRPAAVERKIRLPIHGGGGRVTTSPLRRTTQQQPAQRGSEGRGEGSEGDRTASPILKTHRQAAEIRRERAEREQYLQDQQFLFGPGFQQQRTSLTKTESGGKSTSGSEGQSRCRDVSSLAPSEEDRKQMKSSHAAIKIQSQVRRKAASLRVAAARQGRIVALKTEKNAAGTAAAAASVPKLPIDSLVHRQASATRRAAPKVQREPLAILRQLRTNDSKALPQPRTDQFRLRVTIKSAIKAHIRKTGAARRKPRPLPTPPSWHNQSTASMKTKSLQQQEAATRVRLAKPRATSPLHRTVTQVNRLIAAHKLRGRAAEETGGRRARSAPSRATDRLRCAIFAAETMVEREYARAERRKSFEGTSALADEFSGDLLASPLLMPFQPVV
eukprot:g8493.t1